MLAVVFGCAAADAPRPVRGKGLRLSASGHNYDDPCFWQDPRDSRHALGCITSKGAGQVDCFDLTSGRFVGAAGGFLGEANNCDVDPARAEMVTTDTGRQALLVHELPGLRLARTIPVPGTRDLAGVCVGRMEGRSQFFVTDEATDRVLRIDGRTGEVRAAWVHGLVEAEAIACDDEWQRVVVCDDYSDERGCQAFTYEGVKVGPEFGIEELTADAEGIAIYRCADRSGYLIVSDQARDEFEIFRREDFAHLCTFAMTCNGKRTHDTDGIDVFQSAGFPEGLFGACDDCSDESEDELHVIPWPQIAEACQLRVCQRSLP
jgi:3-phytase